MALIWMSFSENMPYGESAPWGKKKYIDGWCSSTTFSSTGDTNLYTSNNLSGGAGTGASATGGDNYEPLVRVGEEADCRCKMICPVCGECADAILPKGCEPCSCPEVYCLRDGSFEDVINILTDYNCNEESYKQVSELFKDGCVDEYNYGYNTSRTYFEYKSVDIEVDVVFSGNEIIGLKWHVETHNNMVVQYEIQFLGPIIENLGGTFREKIIRIIFPSSNFEEAYDAYLKIKQCM